MHLFSYLYLYLLFVSKGLNAAGRHGGHGAGEIDSRALAQYRRGHRLETKTELRFSSHVTPQSPIRPSREKHCSENEKMREETP